LIDFSIIFLIKNIIYYIIYLEIIEQQLNSIMNNDDVNDDEENEDEGEEEDEYEEDETDYDPSEYDYPDAFKTKDGSVSFEIAG